MNKEDLMMFKMAVESFIQTRFEAYKNDKIHGGDFLASVGPVMQAYDKLSMMVMKHGGGLEGDRKGSTMKNDILESEQFYNLMQAYRHGNRTDQKKVAKAFEAVKKFLRENKEEIFENCNCVHMTGRMEDGSQNKVFQSKKQLQSTS